MFSLMNLSILLYPSQGTLISADYQCWRKATTTLTISIASMSRICFPRTLVDQIYWVSSLSQTGILFLVQLLLNPRYLAESLPALRCRMGVVSLLQKCLRRVLCRKTQPTISGLVVLRLIRSGRLRVCTTTRCTSKFPRVGQVIHPAGTADLSLVVSTALDPLPPRQALSSRARLYDRRHELTRCVNPLTSDLSHPPTLTIDIPPVYKAPILIPSAQRPLTKEDHSTVPRIEPRTTHSRSVQLAL